MTVTSNTTRNDYVAGTNQNVYNYTFQLNEASDVTVYLGGAVQTLNTHYTVQNVGVGTGGTITFTLVDGSNNPIFPTPGTAISIVMAMDLDRDTDYQANGAFLAADVNNDYDRLWLATNQQQTAINRSLRLQDDDVAGASPTMELPLKDDRKGKLLGFHATTGEPITAITINADDYVLKAGDTMTGNLNMGSNKVTSSATPSATSDLTNKQYVDAAVAGVPVGDITAVTAGTGMTGGGTTGDVTLNVIGGTGITANADDISVDNTVVLTTGLQTLGGKSFSNIKLVENGDTKVQWPFGLNDDFFFADNQKVLFGIDMQLYHDGSNSYIKDVGTGNLYIDTNSSTHLSQGGNDKIVITSNQVTVDPRLQFNTLRGAGAIEVDIIRDEDDMSSDDPDALATQQSIKAYVDSQVVGDITAVTAGAGLTGGGTSGDVTLNAIGGTAITVNANDIQVTDNGIGATQLNVSGNGTNGQLLASDGDGTFSWQTGGSGGNETLAQTLALGNTTGGTDISVSSGDNIVVAANSTVDGRDVSVDGTKLDGIEASADVTDTANVTAAGAVMDSELTSIASVKALNQGVATTDSPAFAGLTVDTTTLAVDSTNNRVGIGTTSPNRSLETNSTQQVVASFKSTSTDSARISFSDANTTDDTKVTIGSTGDALKINTLGSERMRVDSSGNVGIGTTSPSEELEIASSSPTIRLTDTDDSTYGSVSYNVNALLLSGDSTIRCYTGGTEHMRIDGSGKVGIGTTSPSYALSVKGLGSSTVPASFESSGSSSWLMLKDSGTTLGNVRVGSSSNALVQYAGGAERMRIDSLGAVIVGKTSSATGIRGSVLHSNGSLYSSIPSGNTYHVYNTTNNNFTFYVGYTGGVINYQSNNVNLSDEREKKNIEPLESKWDSVKSWSLKTFHYNHQADESIKNYGVIAQDVEQTNPEAIDVYQKDENTERKGVKEQQMMWMAIKALQEAQTRIETLETRIAALEE